MRLIDADALFEKVPYGDIEHDVKISKCGAIADICTWILTAPTIDAVPVTRCAKCKHGEFEQENRMWACVRCADYDEDYDMFTGFIEYHKEDHFCSYGERRSDE